MVMQLSKILLLSFIMFFSCKGEAQNKGKNRKLENLNKNNIDFFDKKYKTLYTMIVDESTLSDHPIKTYINCDSVGYFTIHYIPKSESLQLFWRKDYVENQNLEDINDDEENDKIGEIIKKDIKNYAIFSYHVLSKFLNSNSNCSPESVFLKDTAIAEIYYFDQSKQEWKLIKEEKSNILPKIPDSNYFTRKFPHLFKTKKTIDYNLTDNSIWSDNCNSNKNIFISTGLENIQFTIPNRFSMNSRIKKTSNNKYEIFFKDFTPLIPLSSEIQNVDNLDKILPIGSIEIISDSKIKINWKGFYNKILKKYIESKNPFESNLLDKCN